MGGIARSGATIFGVGVVVADGRRQCGSGAQDLARVFASVADSAHAGRCPLRRQANRCREHAMSRRPLIAHVLHSLGTGGMERFAITLINSTVERYRHAIICLTEPGSMLRELEDPSVPCFALHKQPGKDWGCYFRFWRTLHGLKPDLIHSYNIGTLDLAPIAKLAGVRRVVHAERGRDVADPNGESRRYRNLRRWMSPFITRHLAVSRDLESWLVDAVGIERSKVMYMPNGIDARKFIAHAPEAEIRPLLGEFAPPGTLVIINVGRLDAVKDQAGL